MILKSVWCCHWVKHRRNFQISLFRKGLVQQNIVGEGSLSYVCHTQTEVGIPLCMHTERLSPKAELLGFWRGKHWGWQRVPGQSRHLCVAAIPVSTRLRPAPLSWVLKSPYLKKCRTIVLHTAVLPLIKADKYWAGKPLMWRSPSEGFITFCVEVLHWIFLCGCLFFSLFLLGNSLSIPCESANLFERIIFRRKKPMSYDKV